jgi:methyl coenzyme M reductase beta subunit
VVIKGIMHPYSVGSTNYLVHDTVFSSYPSAVQYNGGNLAVLKHLVQ